MKTKSIFDEDSEVTILSGGEVYSGAGTVTVLIEAFYESIIIYKVEERS